MSPAVIDVIAGVTVLCANCRFPIVIPATVRRERDRAEIAALIRAANEQVDPTAHLVYTIKAGMPQRVLARLLGPPTSARPDTWLYRDVPPDGDTVRIGRLLNARGGTTLMRKVYAAVSVRVCHRSRELDLAWDGIGEW